MSILDSTSDSGGFSGGLESILSSLIGGGNLGGSLGNLAALTPLISQLAAGNRNAQTPNLPSISGFGPSTMNINSSPQRQLNPMLASMRPQDWYTYGQKPQSQQTNGGQFFTPSPGAAAPPPTQAPAMQQQPSPLQQAMPAQGMMPPQGMPWMGGLGGMQPPQPMRFIPEMSTATQGMQGQMPHAWMNRGGQVKHFASGGYAPIVDPIAPPVPGPAIHRQAFQGIQGAPTAQPITSPGAINVSNTALSRMQALSRLANLMSGQQSAYGLAKGGALDAYSAHNAPTSADYEQPLQRAARHVKGPGDGTSDEIPAMLSSGEYVIPAHVVSALGNGDNDAGARALDDLQNNVRLSVGKQMAKGQHPSRAKKPKSYMTR